MITHPDKFAGFYNNGLLDFDRRLAYYAYLQFKPYFKGETCLELGPATGYMTCHLLKNFKEVTAVEGSLSLLDQIPDHPSLVKVHSLFEEYEPQKKYDTIVMSHVLEHIYDPVTLLRRIKGWLADDGVFIVGVPNARSFHRLAAVEMNLLETVYTLNDRDRAVGHYRVYDMDSLKKDAVSAGYKVEDTGGIFIKFLSNAQIEEFLNEDILDAYFKLSNSFKENSAEIFLVLS